MTRRSWHKGLSASLRRLGGDRHGISLTEFGLISPVMCLLLVGALDVGHSLYMKAVVEGAVQKAARDTGLESGVVAASQTTVDQKVRDQILPLNKNATIAVSRRFYRTFSKAAAAQAEPFTDTNGDGKCSGESYTDENNNLVRDLDGADAGQGGAEDAVVYTVTVTYNRMFPLHGFIGVPAQQVIKASTVLKNQPYGDQSTYGTPTVRTCPVIV